MRSAPSSRIACQMLSGPAADLLPFTISDMDFATAPCIIEALNQRLMHGVFGYSRWKNDEF
ncbi:hypothetical protein BER12_16205, partial [Escherichia coli]